VRQARGDVAAWREGGGGGGALVRTRGDEGGRQGLGSDEPSFIMRMMCSLGFPMVRAAGFHPTLARMSLSIHVKLCTCELMQLVE